MRGWTPLFLAATFSGSALPAMAQDADFNLTYHVERIEDAKLDIAACGGSVAAVARAAGLDADVKSFPGQLVTVSGGSEGAGVFVAHCIAVEAKTVAVVQGIDYQNAKGPIGDFADAAIAAVMAAAR